jgi:peptide/nickel transport system permease protein
MSPDQLNPATQAINQGDFTAARKLVAQAIVANPSDEQAWLMMARLAEHRDQVIECLERALVLNPANRTTQSALQAVKRGHPAPPSLVPVVTMNAPAVEIDRAARIPARKVEGEAAKPVSLTLTGIGEDTIRPPRQKRNLSLLFGSLIVVLIILIAILGPRLAPQDPMEEHAILQVDSKWYIPPFNAFQVPGYPLGSDQFGRDMLSRILYAVRPTLIMVTIVAFVRLFLGTLIGLGAGWSIGRFGHFLDGLISAALSVPILLVALGAITMLGTASGLTAFIVGLSINGWGETARLVRQQTQLIKDQLFIESARSQGASTFHILYQHILRQIMPMVWMLFAFEISGTLMVTGGLGFLGYYIGGGVWIEVADFVSRRTSGAPELGQMLATSWVNLLQPWPLVLTGSVVFLIILGFNLFGEGLRSRLNPVYINHVNIIARYSQRFSLWFEDAIGYPLSNWFRASWLHPAMAGVAVVALGSSIYLYQTKIATRFNPTLATLSVPGGQIWASERVDPYGTAYFNDVGPASSNKLWQITHPAGFSGSPAIAANGTIYIAGQDGVLFALNPDGSVLWRAALPVTPFGPITLGIQGDIYVTNAKNGISAISPEGNLLWTYSINAIGEPNHGAIVAPDGNIYYLIKSPSGDTLVALSPNGQLLWSKQPGTYGADDGLRLSPDGSQIFVKDVVVNATDGSVVRLTLPTQNNPILGNQAQLLVGADGKTYLLAGHTVIQWVEGSQGFNILQSANWDYRGQGMNQNSGFPIDAGVSPQGNIWLFYSGFYGNTSIFWLGPTGTLIGKAYGVLNQSTRLVAVDGNGIAYVCGIGFSNLQGPNATLCEAHRANETVPVWSYLFPEGANGIIGAAMAPGLLYAVTQAGDLVALGSSANPSPSLTPTSSP